MKPRLDALARDGIARTGRSGDRYGFEAVGVRRGYYQPSNTDAVVMRVDI